MSIVGYQQYAGSTGHVAVIGDIDQEFGEDPVLNPAMKNRDRQTKIKRRAGAAKQLYLEVIHD
jgi:hypothetical protein